MTHRPSQTSHGQTGDVSCAFRIIHRPNVSIEVFNIYHLERVVPAGGMTEDDVKQPKIGNPISQGADQHQHDWH
jgi:hypothetical protein